MKHTKETSENFPLWVVQATRQLGGCTEQLDVHSAEGRRITSVDQCCMIVEMLDNITYEIATRDPVHFSSVVHTQIVDQGLLDPYLPLLLLDLPLLLSAIIDAKPPMRRKWCL